MVVGNVMFQFLLLLLTYLRYDHLVSYTDEGLLTEWPYVSPDVTCECVVLVWCCKVWFVSSYDTVWQVYTVSIQVGQ